MNNTYYWMIFRLAGTTFFQGTDGIIVPGSTNDDIYLMENGKEEQWDLCGCKQSVIVAYGY
jgi:hypothetical protein